MSAKQKAWLKFQEAQKRDEQLCQCGHTRGKHMGDKNCCFHSVDQCECLQFRAKEGA